MLITLIYGAWEDKYREQLAEALGYAEKNRVKHDLFYDLAKLRHAVVHNGGIATSEVEEARVLKWFKQFKRGGRPQSSR
jgi:hypothetical protein